MALPNRHLELRFNSGADQSQDPDITEAPIDTLVDFEYRKDGKLTKRRGWQTVGDLEAGMDAASLLTNDRSVAVLARNAVVGVTSAVDVEASGRLRNAARFGVRRLAVLPSSNNFTDADVAVRGDGLICVAATKYDGTSYTMRLFLFDSTGVCRWIGDNTDGANPRVVARNSTTFDVYYRKISDHTIGVTHISGDPSAGGTVTSTSGLVTLHATYVAFDAIVGPFGIAYLAYNNGSGHLVLAKSTTGAAIAASYDTGITTADYPSLAVNVGDASLACVYATKGGTGASQIAADLTPSATTHGPTVIDSGANIVRTAVVGLTNDDNNGTFALLQRATTAFGLTRKTITAYLKADHSGLVNTTQNQTLFSSRPVTLPSSGFDPNYDANRPYAVVQPGYSNLNDLAEIPTALLGMFQTVASGNFASSTAPAFTTLGYYPAAALLTDQAGQLADGAPACSVAYDGNQTWYVASLHIVDESIGSPHTNISLLAIDIQPPPEPQAILGRTVYVGGGLLRFWDGVEFGETTPPWSNFSPTAVTAGAGLNPAAGDYKYVSVLEWTDAQGEVHRGPVSAVGSIEGHTGGSITVTVRIHVPTGVVDSATVRRWVYKLYRTTTLTGPSPGTIFYLVLQKALANNDDTLTVTDDWSDLTLSEGGREVLYTTGGVLEAQLPPALTSLVVHRNRLWGLDAVDPRNLWPSQVKVEGFSVEFNHALSQRVEQGSVPVALASMDDKLLVFTGTETLAILGDGPDATGVPSGSASFTEAEIVVPGVGATGPHSVVTTPLGVIVHSPSGFKLIGRDLSPSDIGGALLDTAPGTATIRRSLHVISRQQAWFLLTGGAIVVFDYSRGNIRWYKFTSQDTTTISDIAYVGGLVYLLGVRTGGASRLYVMDWASTHADDAGVFVPASVRSGWVRPDGLLGEARFRVVHAYGKANTDSGLSMLVEVQGAEPHANQTFTWTYAELVALAPAHPRHRPNPQRGQGIRVTLTQLTGATANSEGFQPHGFGIDFGAHGRTGRTPGSGAPGSP